MASAGSKHNDKDNHGYGGCFRMKEPEFRMSSRDQDISRMDAAVMQMQPVRMRVGLG